MKTYYTILLISSLFFSCSNNKTATVSEPIVEQDYYRTACDSFVIKYNYQISDAGKSAITFTNYTPIYCTPAKRKDTINWLPFNTRINVIQTLKLPNEQGISEQWFKIKYRDKIGFVLNNGMALSGGNSHYLIGRSPHNHYNAMLISLEPGLENSPKDTCYLNYMHAHRDDLLRFNGLDFSKNIIHVTSFRESCPGATSHEFIRLDDEGNLTKIISSYSTGEMGYFDEEQIYFPLKFESGKTLLVANGEIDFIFNTSSGELNTFEYPNEPGIPINQLIVKTKKYTEDCLQKYTNRQNLVEKTYFVEAEENGEMKQVRVFEEKPQFYKWDGTELKQIL